MLFATGCLDFVMQIHHHAVVAHRRYAGADEAFMGICKMMDFLGWLGSDWSVGGLADSRVIY